MSKLSYHAAYLSALKFYFQGAILRYQSLGIPNDFRTLREHYRLAKYNAASYAFNMKSEHLSSIPVW